MPRPTQYHPISTLVKAKRELLLPAVRHEALAKLIITARHPRGAKAQLTRETLVEVSKDGIPALGALGRVAIELQQAMIDYTHKTGKPATRMRWTLDFEIQPKKKV